MIGIVQVLVAARNPFYTWGDHAVIDMSVRNAIGLDQLLGPYGRIGSHHPGPLYYYFLAPLHPLLPNALRSHLGALVLNWAAASAAILLAVRYTGRRTATCLTVVLLVLLFALGPIFLRDPWNPSAVVLPILVAVIAVAVRPTTLTTCVAVVCGSLAVQAHVGTLSAVGVLGLVAVVLGPAMAFVWDGRRRLADLWPGWRPVLTVVVVFLACWSAPIVEQVQRGDEGNLTKVMTFLVSSKGAQRGLRASADLVVGASWLPSVPLLGPPSDPPGPPATFAFLGLACALAGACVAWRRRDRVALVLCAYAAVGFPISAISVSRVSGEVFVYLLWWIPVNVVALLAGLGVLALGDRSRTASTRIAPGELALRASVVALTLALVATTLQSDAVPEGVTSEQVEEMWALVESRIDPDDVVYLQIIDQPIWPYAVGIAVLLDDRGIEYTVDDEYEHLFPTAGVGVDPTVELMLGWSGSGNDDAQPRRADVVAGDLPGALPISVRTLRP